MRPDWLTERPVAHRGFHDPAEGRIENTLSAVAAAVRRDFAIELDLQLSADGKVIVFHDETLDRLTGGRGRVDRLTLAELKAVRLHDSDESIPTLDDVLEEVTGRVPLFLELKSNWRNDRSIARHVAQALARYTGPVAVMSFDPNVLVTFRRLSPRIPRGVVSGVSVDVPGLPPYLRVAYRHLLTASLALPNFIAYEVNALPAVAPLAFRSMAGLPLFAWTVRTTGDLATARRWADQIIFEGFDPRE